MPKPHSLTPRRAPRRSQELRTSSTNTSSLPTMAPSNNRKRSSPMKPQPNTRRQPYRLPCRRPSLLHPQPSYNKLLPLTQRGTSPSRRQPLCHKPQPRRLTPQHRPKQDLHCLPHCLVHSRHLRRSPKQHQSLLSTIHSPRSITWTRTRRHTGCSLQTMRWTAQQPLPGSPCLQPHALQGLRGQMSGGWQSPSSTQTAPATSPSLPALAG